MRGWFETKWAKTCLSVNDPIADDEHRFNNESVTDRYLPTSAFLNSVAQGEVVLDSSTFGQQNLGRLLAMVRDDDRTNRDWAAFLISGLPQNSEAICEALRTASQDADDDTRDEAVVGLARKDRQFALQVIEPLLADDPSYILLEAAEILGEQSLVAALDTAQASGAITDKMRVMWERAYAACSAGIGVDFAPDELSDQHRLF